MVEITTLARVVEKLTAPLARRVRLTARRAVVTLVNDALKTQEVQITVFNDETLDQVERLQNYGLTSHPHPGSDVAVLALGGSTSHSIAVVVADKRYRLTGLEEGEVALHDDQGQVVFLRRCGIEIKTPLNILLSALGIMRLEAEGVEIHGRTYVQTDVHGKGTRETWTGGSAFQTDSYTTGTTGASTEHGFSPDTLPSDHPGAGV